MRNIHIKRLAAFAAAALCVLALAGCGQAAALPRPKPTEGATTVTITGNCAISKSGNDITVSGAIDVMNGAYINISVVAQNGMVLANKTIQKSDAPISETFPLTDEQLASAVDLKGYICCAPSYYQKQPNEVYAAYGKKFENIANGEDTAVFTNEGVILTFASDWLNGVIPSPTAGPTPSPTPAASTSASAETTASAGSSPSA
jgi:hypothetical protein